VFPPEQKPPQLDERCQIDDSDAIRGTPDAKEWARFVTKDGQLVFHVGLHEAGTVCHRRAARPHGVGHYRSRLVNERRAEHGMRVQRIRSHRVCRRAVDVPRMFFDIRQLDRLESVALVRAEQQNDSRRCESS